MAEAAVRPTPELDDTIERLPTSFDLCYTWNYETLRQELKNLYEKAKRDQWNATDQLPWATSVDPEAEIVPDFQIPVYDTHIWQKMTPAEIRKLRRESLSWTLSQFMHGEQGALLCASKIVQQVPSIDAKFYAATQVMDEARHVEVYARLLHEKFELAYPITPTLKALLDNVLTDARWDMTYLGMQVLIEGLALAAFASIRDHAKNALAAAVNAYVMEDEARHVAFGRIALRDYYPQLTDAERDEREEFAVEACYLMRDRFLSIEVWETLGLPVDECVQMVQASERMKLFRTRLFTRIVPTIKDIGLWGPRIRKAYADMGVMAYAEVDAEGLLTRDEQVAAEFDARRGRRA